MVSRVSLVAALLVMAALVASGTGARTPPVGTSMFLVRQDPRLCPSPLCGGYWVALANGVRTRCGDVQPQARCYVADAVDRHGRQLGAGMPEGSLARGSLAQGLRIGDRVLDRLTVAAVYAPAGSALVSGGYYRVFDTGVRCIRAPCFSFRARQVNGSSSVTASSIDLEAASAAPAEVERAQLALRTKDGLYARGRFASTPDGGRIFRALRLYLRAPLPRA